MNKVKRTARKRYLVNRGGGKIWTSGPNRFIGGDAESQQPSRSAIKEMQFRRDATITPLNRYAEQSARNFPNSLDTQTPGSRRQVNLTFGSKI